jgi:hypothetical protein
MTPGFRRRGQLPATVGSVSGDRIRTGLRDSARRLGRIRLGVLAIGRIVSPVQRKLYRRSGGRISLSDALPCCY